MEIKEPDRYVGFLKQFMIKCPPPGRGKASNKFDFAVLDYEEAHGVRTSDLQECLELCEEDFITYFTTKAPAYQRDLAELSCTKACSVDYRLSTLDDRLSIIRLSSE